MFRTIKQIAMNLDPQDSKLDYRLLLIKEFQQRRQKNRAYSLTAFARALGVSAAYLSQVFAGKRTLSEVAAQSFARKLRWASPQRNLFLSLVRFKRAPNEESKVAALTEIEDLSELDFLELEVDQFEVISEWFHFAIVELSDLPAFRNEPAWIAKRLKISVDDASSGLNRLQRLGILQFAEGRFNKAKPFHRKKDVPSSAGRAFHETHLEKAILALDTQDFDKRDFSGTTLSINQKHLPEVKEMIREFRNKLNRFCAKSESPDAVYQLAVQFFRLDSEVTASVPASQRRKNQ